MMSDNLQEEKDKLQAIGEEFVRTILDAEFEIQTAESIEKLQQFYDEWILAQKTLLSEYATRAETAETSCEDSMEEIKEIFENINKISEDLKTALESATAASTQSVNSAEASQNASETALASAVIAQNATKNINLILAQFETSYQTIMENIEHLHEDAQTVTTALDNAQEILPIIEEFIKLSPDIGELEIMIENISSEILPDLRRMQQMLIDQLKESEIMYDNLRINILPNATYSIEQLTLLLKEVKDVNISQALIDLAQIELYKKEIEEFTTLLNESINNAESLKTFFDEATLNFQNFVNKESQDFKDLVDQKTGEITTLGDEKLANLFDFLVTQNILDLKGLSQLKLESPLINLITQNLQINGTPYMEMGVSDNGHYVKFENGFLVCFGNKYLHKIMTNGETVTFIFPISCSIKSITLNNHMGNGGTTLHTNIVDNNSFTVRFNVVADPYVYGIYYIAIGLWK